MMKDCLFTATMTLLALLIAGCADFPETPEETASYVLENLPNSDFQILNRYVIESKHPELREIIDELAREANTSCGLISLDVHSTRLVEQTAVNALVHMEFTLSCTKSGELEHERDDFPLVREEGVWKMASLGGGY